MIKFYFTVRCVSINILLLALMLIFSNIIYQTITNKMINSPPLPSLVVNQLNNPILSCICCLSGDHLKDFILDKSSSSSEGQSPFGQTSNVVKKEWITLFKLIDRILLVIYTVTLIIYHA